MATKKQIPANRLNARKSTGPRTPEGKRRVALNAQECTGPKTEEGKLRASANSRVHGLSTAHLTITQEQQERYAEHCQRCWETYKPTSPEQLEIVEVISQSLWRKDITLTSETEVLRRVYQEYGNLNLLQDAKATRRFLGISRYEGKASNTFFRSLDLLREIKKRQNEVKPSNLN